MKDNAVLNNYRFMLIHVRSQNHVLAWNLKMDNDWKEKKVNYVKQSAFMAHCKRSKKVLPEFHRQLSLIIS